MDGVGVGLALDIWFLVRVRRWFLVRVKETDLYVSLPRVQTFLRETTKVESVCQHTCLDICDGDRNKGCCESPHDILPDFQCDHAGDAGIVAGALPVSQRGIRSRCVRPNLKPLYVSRYPGSVRSVIEASESLMIRVYS